MRGRLERYHSGLAPKLALFAAGAILLWWRTRPFTVEVEGDSMSPTLVPGDYLVAVRRHRVDPGALVVVDHPARPGFEMVKRVAGVPGDRVGDRLVGPAELWVTGDNPHASTDSRAFGPIRRTNVRGVVVARYWPLATACAFRPDGRAERGARFRLG